jgi:signal transduction histidine kinase
MLGGWISRLSIGQKLVVSFSLILLLLAVSLSAILIYVSRVNSYVDRHQRITIPGVVTASEILRNLGQLQSHLHRLVEHRKSTDAGPTLATIARLERQTLEAIETYRQRHAARTHPILFGMLMHHGRGDLANQEDRAIETITVNLTALTELRQQVESRLAEPTADPTALAAVGQAYHSAAAAVEEAVVTLIDVHRKIDIEMKIEGDRLVDQARLVALALVCFLSLLIISVFVLMRRQVANPLRRLAATADRVAHHDLTAQFGHWPSRDEVGALAGSLTTMLTSLRDHSMALEHKTKELEAFTYSIAHDLKGPLREIEGFSSLLEKQFAESGDSTARHHVGVIRQSALRLTRMIDALLKYSRLEQQNLPRQRFNVLDMISSLVSDRLGSMLDDKPTVTIDVPFTELYGEPVSIRQAIANLLDNAVKFSRLRAQPEIRISGWTTETEHVISVADNGIGFDMDQSEKIFGLFERLHSPQEYEGTGVGLAIVKLVVEKHQGRAWAESVPGKGSAFFLAFPNLMAGSQ